MAIYRGPGGAGDATGDATNASALALAAKDAAQASATSAASSATAAASSATSASTSATDAATSETNAAGSATTASTAATNASNSASDAADSATEAASSASDAADSATEAASSASSASTDASTASTQATNAASSASSASTSAGTATTKASEASTSATNAASSASSASTSATNASNSASAAATSETNAASSASSASTSASTATTKASEAATSATNAASSASAASTSASSASSSASAASTSATNAASSATSAASSATSAASNATAAAASAVTAATFDPALYLAKADNLSGLANTVTAANNIGLNPYGNGFKNRIINGAMMIDQRNAGASVTNTTSLLYPVDRFAVVGSQASKFTAQQSSTAPSGFVNSLICTSSSAYTVGVSEDFSIRHYAEGLNVSDLGWGSAGASAVTLSFWARSSLTGTFGGSIANAAQDRFYVFSYTINAANTWEYKTITISGDTSGTWLTTNGLGIRLFWSLGAGSTVSGTAGSWGSTLYRSATGATSVVGTSGATFYITGVQLEKGSTATSFDYRPYGTELALCYRYYYQTVSNEGIGVVYSSTQAAFKAKLPVTMRSNPSLTMPTSGSFRGDMVNGNKTSAVAPISANPNVSEIYWYNTGYSSASAGELVYWLGSSIKASAEL